MASSSDGQFGHSNNDSSHGGYGKSSLRHMLGQRDDMIQAAEEKAAKGEMRAAEEPEEISDEALDALVLYPELLKRYDAQVTRIEEMCQRNLAVRREASKKAFPPPAEKAPLPPPATKTEMDILVELLNRSKKPQGAAATTTTTSTQPPPPPPPAPPKTDEEELEELLRRSTIFRERNESARGDRCSESESTKDLLAKATEEKLLWKTKAESLQATVAKLEADLRECENREVEYRRRWRDLEDRKSNTTSQEAAVAERMRELLEG